MSLHVVPRPSAQLPVETDEERTALDEGDAIRKAAAEWEDGTTVEESTIAQGKAYRSQEKAFDPGGNTTNTTSTSGQTIDELTVEEQARPLPPLQLVRAEPARAAASKAKLVVVAGTDTGREFDVVAGRAISIGRATDNDIVLTDISVSRKHFELIFDVERWVLRDRGSGNGTLINDRMEDGSCQLHHGDRIEIGNTSFRFDHPSSMVQAPSASVGWGQREDEDARTVAGKPPVRDDVLDMPAHPATTLPGTGGAPRRESARNQVRARTNSGPLARAAHVPGLPATPPGMAPPGVASPNAPTLAPQMYPVLPPPTAPPGSPTMNAFAQPGHGHIISEYPASSGTHNAARVSSSGALRPSYQREAVQPPISLPRRSGGARYALIASVAVIVSGIGIGAAALGGSAADTPKQQITTPKLKRPVLNAQKKEAVPAPAPVTTTVPAPAPTPTKPVESSTITTTPIAPPQTPPTPTPQVATATPTPTPSTVTVTPVPVDPKVEAEKQKAEAAEAERRLAEYDKQLAANAEAEKERQREAAKLAGMSEAEKQKLAEAEKQKAAEAEKQKAAEAEKQKLAEEKKQKDEADRLAAAEKKKAQDAEKAKKAEEKRLARLEEQKKREEAADRRAEERKRRRERAAEAEKENEDNGSTASTSGGGGSGGPPAGAVEKAESEYQAGKYRDAAATLRAAASKASGGVADDLRAQAANYNQIADGFTAGKTQASSNPIGTLAKLKIALDADRKAGGVHKSELRSLLAEVAPKAAIAQMVANNYEAAFKAANDADSYGASAGVATVRKGLNAKAAEFTNNGQKLLASDPTQAKSLLNRVLRIVPKDNMWYSRAQKILTGDGVR